MALSTNRVCAPRVERSMCPPRIIRCPGGCLPGFCLNAQCPNRFQHEIIYGRPEFEREAEIYRQCIDKVIQENKRREREEFLSSERKVMGMREPTAEEKKKAPIYRKESDVSDSTFHCPPIELSQLKILEGQKSMRERLHKNCMLKVPEYIPPTDDYSQLSHFLRVSTMPGCSINNSISEYRDNYNMAVWNNRKDLDKQVYKFKRDWLSVWGELNVKEQNWRKSWVEKFGGGGIVKK